MKRVFVVGVLSVMVSSCKVDYSDGCIRICEAAAACRLLPSPLGAGSGDAAERNCKARCTNTPKGDREEIASCFETVIESAGKVFDWCETANAGQEESDCSKAARCLEEAFPDTPIVGVGELRLTVTLPRPDATCATTQPDGGNQCSSDGGMPQAAVCSSDAIKPSNQCGVVRGSEDNLCRPNASVLCAALGDPALLVRLERYGRIESERQYTCAEALANELFFRELPTGLATPTVNVLGVLPAEPGDPAAPENVGAPFCVAFKGLPVPVIAGEVSHATIVIARDIDDSDSSRCEMGDILCSDGADNDGDNLADCHDPECACVPPTPVTDGSMVLSVDSSAP